MKEKIPTGGSAEAIKQGCTCPVLDNNYGKGSDWEMKEFSKRYNIWENSVSSKYKGHSATFPENLVTDHILSWSNEGDIVFDPFMGSGTTGVCSLRLNRKFVGIEKVTEYFNYSKERIIESI